MTDMIEETVEEQQKQPADSPLDHVNPDPEDLVTVVVEIGENILDTVSSVLDNIDINF